MKAPTAALSAIVLSALFAQAMLSHYLDQGALLADSLAAAAIDFVFVSTLALVLIARRHFKE